MVIQSYIFHWRVFSGSSSRAVSLPPTNCLPRALFLTLNHIYLTLLRKIFVIRRWRKKSTVQVLGSYAWLGVNPVAGRVRDCQDVMFIFGSDMVFSDGKVKRIDSRLRRDTATRQTLYTCDFLTAHPICLTPNQFQSDAALFVNIKVLSASDSLIIIFDGSELMPY